MSNTITAYFKGRVGVAESVYQNDYGIVMAFDSIDLPAHFDCYFSRLNQEEALPGLGADNRVTIPNSILANPGNVTIHIPLHIGANDSEVEYIVYFKVIGRARPIDDGTPTQMTAIEQALALLQNPITNIEQIVNEALAFTGETFEEMQEDLDEWKTDVESDFDNLDAQFQTAVAAVTTDTEVTNIRVGDDNVIYTTAGEAVRTQFANVKSDINNKIDSVRNVNLNNNPFYDSILMDYPTPSLTSRDWGFSSEPTSYSVADGKLTYSPSARSAKLAKNFYFTQNHKYYMYLPITSSSQDAFADIMGVYGGENKGHKNYVTDTFTFTYSSRFAYLTVQGASGYSYTLGQLVVIDLTETGLSESEAKIITQYLISNGAVNQGEFVERNTITENKKIISVRAYGAYGDGKDYTAEIANAISACPTNGIVYLPCGEYVVSNIALKDDMTFMGDGKGSVIKFANNVATANQNCLSVNNVENVTIKDVLLDGNRSNNASPADSADGGYNCIHINGSSNILIDNVVGKSAGYHGIIMVNAHDVEVRNSEFYDCGFRPIHGHSAVSNVLISNCECHNNGNGFVEGGVSTEGYDAIFFFDDAENIAISDCYLYDITTLAGIQIGGDLLGNGSASSKFLIANNTIDCASTIHGIQLMGQGISDVRIIGNRINGKVGVYGINIGDNKNITIADNNIIDCTQFGIRFIDKYTDLIISNNNIVNGSQFGIHLVSVDRAIINSNNVADFQFCIVTESSDNIIISSNISGKIADDACISSLQAKASCNNVKMIYNIANQAVSNNSVGGIVL
jgi:hypothetical protein